MAEQLKNSFGPDVPKRLARDLSAVSPRFDADAFLSDCLDGYAPLALMPRGRKIAAALRRHLPQDYAKAIGVLLDSLGPKLQKTEGSGMAPFFYLPHVFFVAEYGLDHFEESMRAQYELTQRFTAEFSIRPYLEKHQTATLARLKKWTDDPSVHVRRLVSEGTRPRLPWAPRLRAFMADPKPVLALLERLKDDPELYVRRSVANNLNDIGKDHPDTLTQVARRWLKDASEERRRLVNHALRTAVKRGEPGALEVLGFGGNADVALRAIDVSPARAAIGGKVTVSFEVANTGPKRQAVLVDFRVHFVKTNGKTSPKVFKLKTLDLAAGASQRVTKTVSLAEMTTRKHFPGRHVVDVLLNGRVRPLGAFTLSRR